MVFLECVGFQEEEATQNAAGERFLKSFGCITEEKVYKGNHWVNSPSSNMRGDPLDIIERASLVSSSSSSSSSSDETAKKVAKKSSLTSSKVEPGDTSDSSASSASEVEYLYKQVKITKAHKILPPQKNN